ncbi:hypothetical protein [Corynebacterium callunae]|uniref:Lipoprotein n=1 Tax=Corynebacterium callunae DSM 20147 TaxID=1121353 RepID=M1TRH2_9CORY|nr:hypothetical protein [Corynebacterium callunae]AGG66891.1 hypothetical protein H924_07245 [Corynebacterium callunae DSM 20147]
MTNFKPAAATALAVAMTLSACSTESLDGELTSTGADAGFRLEAWCDDASALALGVKWGDNDKMEDVLISSDLGGAMGDVESYKHSYGLADFPSATLTVFAVPTDGTCHITLRDDVSGTALERSFDEDAEEFTLIGYASKS